MRATPPQEVATVPGLIDELKRSGHPLRAGVPAWPATRNCCGAIAETRRKHPLSSAQRGLREAIQLERELLAPIANAADRIIDTSRMGCTTCANSCTGAWRTGRRALTIPFESFGFKRGIPGDSDFVFDARTLPNPYWEATLRRLTGRDAGVIGFLEQHEAVPRLIHDIESFITGRIPEYQASNRGYLTVAVGCTGGRHRSV